MTPLLKLSPDERGYIHVLFRNHLRTWQRYKRKHDAPILVVSRIFWQSARRDAHAIFS